MKLNVEALVGSVTEYSSGRNFIKKEQTKIYTPPVKVHVGMVDTARELYSVFNTAWCKAYYLYLLSEAQYAPDVRRVGNEMSRELAEGKLDKTQGRTVGNYLYQLFASPPTKEEVYLHLSDALLDDEHKEAVLLLCKASIQQMEIKPSEFRTLFPLTAEQRSYLENNLHYLADNG
jgi:hypothetical protein